MEYIYELVCPIRGVTRYIGKAKNPERRLKKHLNDARNPQCYNHRWIAALARQSLVPSMRVVASVIPGESWQDVERACIAQGVALGLPLTNTTKGGEGVVMASAAAEARRVERVRSAWRCPELRRAQAEINKANQNRPGAREANRARVIERWKDPAYAALNARRVAEAYSTPEARAAQSLRSIEAHKNPESKARRSASIKAAWAAPGAYEKHMTALRASWDSPECKAKRSASMRERHKDPVFAAKLRKAMADPEMIKRRGLAISAAKQRKRAERLAREAACPA